MPLSKLQHILQRVQRPGRYADGEWNAVHKDWAHADLKVALCFADAYEAGMASLELLTLYSLLNHRHGWLAERAFMPWDDMAAELRREGLPLFSLESRRPLAEFDALIFCLGRELGATNVLEMLDLAGLPTVAAQREASTPLVMALGRDIGNWEPLSGFVDLALVGEPEDVLAEVLEVLSHSKDAAKGKLLLELAGVPGAYVPSLYEPHYNADGGFEAVEALCGQAPLSPASRRSARLAPPVVDLVVPYLDTLSDAGMVEVFRDCGGVCQGCASGNACLMLRERSPEEVLVAIEGLLQRCGYREIALLPRLVTGYERVLPILRQTARRYRPEDLTLALPALMVTPTFVEQAAAEHYLEAVAETFRLGWHTARYTAILDGRPISDDFVEGLADLVSRTQALGREVLGRRPKVRVEIREHMPRAGTGDERRGQRHPDESAAELTRLKKALKRTGAQVTAWEPWMTFTEGALARGDRRLGAAIEEAWRLGLKLQTMPQRFDAEKWRQACEQAGLSLEAVALQERHEAEALPWGHVDAGGSGAEARGTCRTSPCVFCGVETALSSGPRGLAGAREPR